MKTIQTHRGWWLITPENDEQEAALKSFLSRYKSGPGPAPTGTIEHSRDVDMRQAVEPVASR
jgi:hypothetical protein